MRLRDIEKGKRAIKRIPFRPVKGAVQPGRAPLEASADEISLGVRVLTGEETAEVYEKAKADALARGAERWDEEDSSCRLHLMVHMVTAGCVEVPDDPLAPVPDEPAPFFDSAEQLRTSTLIGRDNIVYLYDHVEKWQADCGFPERKLTPEQLIGLLMQEAERPENADSPLDRMAPALVRSSFRTMAALYKSSLLGKSASGSSGAPNTASGSATSRSARKKTRPTRSRS